MTALCYESALNLLKRLLSESTEGSGRLALVEGGLASGKTHLLHEFSRHAADSGALLLTATASRAEQSLQLGVADQLFRSAGATADLPERVARLIPVDITKWEDGGPDELTHQHAGAGWVRELCRVLLELCEDRPLVIAIDDAQFADTMSQRLLLSLRLRMGPARVLVVLTEWNRAQATAPAFRAELTRHPYSLVRLSPMSLHGIADLVERTGGPADAAALAQGYHDLTGGNPMLVHALLDDQPVGDRDENVQALRTPVAGVSYAQAVQACLHRWQPELLDVARAAAVLRDRTSPTLTGSLLGIRPVVAEEYLTILTDAGVLTQRRFRHQLAEAAVLDAMSPAERSALHVRAAELLYQRGAGASEVADHLLIADRPEGAWAVTALRATAEQALAGNDVTTAVRCLEMALDSCTERRERVAIVFMLTRALWRVNPAAAAPYLGRLQEAVHDGDLTGADAATVVRYSLWNGDEEAAARAATTLTASPGLLDPQTTAELSVAYHWYFGSTRGRLQDFGTHTPANRDPWADAANRLTTLWLRGGSDAATASAEHILQSCHIDDTTLEVVAAAVLALLCGNKTELANSWCERLTQQAVRRGEVTWRAVLGALTAGIALRRGDPVSAAAHAESALALLPTQGWGVFIGHPRSTLLMANTAMGRHKAAAEIMQQPVPEAMFGTVFSLQFLYARGHYFLADDQALAASRDFQTAGRLMREWDVDVPALIPWRSGLAEVNLRLGRLAEARELIKQQLDRSKVIDVRTRGISLRVLAATSELGQRPALLRQAVECLRAADDRLELSRALTDFSVVHQQLGEFDRARVLARSAAQVTQASGPGPAIQLTHAGSSGAPTLRSRRQCDDVGRHPILSEAERRVAELAVLGHTNREISRTLYITVSTVEQHLTRVYRKLGIAKRSELSVERALQRQPADCRSDEVSSVSSVSDMIRQNGQAREDIAG